MDSIHQSNSSLKRSRAMALSSTVAMGLAMTVIFALTGGFVSSALAKAPAYNLLYTFTGGADGANPVAGLVADKVGNLFGTTNSGGTGNGGTVFKLAPGGTLTTLHAFTNDGTDGIGSYGGLILDKTGNLFGTTYSGGASGAGIVFRIAPDGTETVLYSFTGGNDGALPQSALLERHGNLYGMTSAGGKYQFGVVFKVAPDGTQKVLHNFKGGADGANPAYNALIADNVGNLYGTTQSGGTGGSGTVFKLTGHQETVLYSFQGGGDGSTPEAALLLDKSGNLYGTTWTGGTSDLGTVYKIAPDGTHTVLYSFKGGNDGEYCNSSLVLDKAGNLYGTTNYGGGAGDGYGTGFKLAPDGTETVLYAFTGASDQGYPVGGVIADPSAQRGVLFGTTSYVGNGTIYSIKK